MRHPVSALPRCTNPYPWRASLPFDPNIPFGSGSLGVLCNSAGVAAPDTSTLRHITSAENYSRNGTNTPGANEPVANPSNLGTGYFWCEPLEMADILLIRPFLVLYSSSAHTALAAAAAQSGITAKLSWFLVKYIGTPRENDPVEYTAEYKGAVTLTNAANRTNSATRKLPTGAQWCDGSTVNADATIEPGIKEDGELSGGALRLRFDQEGATHLITYVSDLTANAGAGWLRSHL